MHTEAVNRQKEELVAKLEAILNSPTFSRYAHDFRSDLGLDDCTCPECKLEKIYAIVQEMKQL